MKKGRSFTIAISGVSAALAIIAVVGFAFLPTMKLSMGVISALAIALPLTVGRPVGSIFAYLVSSLVCFFIANINSLPFIVFFGAYTLLTWALDFKFYKISWNKWIKIPIIAVIKIGYCFLAMFLCYKFMNVIIGDMTLFGLKWTMPLLFGLGFIVFSAYDPLFRLVFQGLSQFIQRRFSRYLD